MKTLLPSQSATHQFRIEEITKIILQTSENKVAFIILFGPFARGDWIRYRHNDAGITHEYLSDYNFLIITKDGNGTGKFFDLERKIKKKIEGSTGAKESHSSHIIIEPINLVNKELEKSQYFFCDIIKEGILLYNSGEFELSNPKQTGEEEQKEAAKANYEHWFNGASGFLVDYQSALKRNDYKKASFYLHQATENLYNCTLLTLGGYKPKSHDLEELNQLCAFYSHDFLTIFPKANKEQKECFKLLQQAYIDARYSKYFHINHGQLEYLTTRVERLKGLVEAVCR